MKGSQDRHSRQNTGSRDWRSKQQREVLLTDVLPMAYSAYFITSPRIIFSGLT